MTRRLCMVDVFAAVPYQGNPVAVVLDGEGLTAEQMQQFARWMNLSETTFVLPPTDAGADYQVRIFTPVEEVPFAGHPTLGTCHAWLAAGGTPRQRGAAVQQCPAGLVTLRQTDAGLAFAAPALLREGPVDKPLLSSLASSLRIEHSDIVDASWADNGPGWVALLLSSADAVLALKPSQIEHPVGVVGPYPPGSATAFEVRAFFPLGGGSHMEDPVTGSLNASLAKWLLGAGYARSPYVVSQGTLVGRSGRVHISGDPSSSIWVAGGTVTCLSGEVEL